jgi:hypothetical protein
MNSGVVFVVGTVNRPLDPWDPVILQRPNEADAGWRDCKVHDECILLLEQRGKAQEDIGGPSHAGHIDAEDTRLNVGVDIDNRYFGLFSKVVVNLVRHVQAGIRMASEETSWVVGLGGLLMCALVNIQAL